MQVVTGSNPTQSSKLFVLILVSVVVEHILYSSIYLELINVSLCLVNQVELGNLGGGLLQERWDGGSWNMVTGGKWCRWQVGGGTGDRWVVQGVKR